MTAAPTDSRSSSIRPGALVLGRYRVEEELSAGAMGAVFRGKHEALGHGVAIKVLHGAAKSSPDARARFEREARLAARLGESSANIARVHDFGHFDDGAPILVMELLHGEELGDRLGREGRLPLAMAARVIHQLCRGLSVAHAAGVVHRDVKPSNVFLCRVDAHGGLLVKLMDFGIAKATLEVFDDGPTSSRVEATRAGAVLGTPAYMSPEQVIGASQIDERADLFSVAAMVYKMVVGLPPFGPGTFQEVSARILTADPVAPSRIVPSLRAEFDAWMKQGLAKSPENRFQSAREMAEALAAVAGLRPADLRPRLHRSLDDTETLAPLVEPESTRPAPPKATKNADEEVTVSRLRVSSPPPSWSARPTRGRKARWTIAIGATVVAFVGLLGLRPLALSHAESVARISAATLLPPSLGLPATSGDDTPKATEPAQR